VHKSRQDSGESTPKQASWLLATNDCVTRVYANNNVEILLFVEDAESQAWHPGFITTVGGASLEGNAPPDQLANVHGYGWMPEVDVNPQHQPYPPTRAQAECLSLLKSQGLIPKGYNDYLEAYTTCDAVFLYADALRLTGGSTTANRVAQAIESLGTSFQAASTYGGITDFSVSRRDAPAEWRPWAWSAGCSCFEYQGSPHAFPTAG
jgi:hypothetical protein